MITKYNVGDTVLLKCEVTSMTADGNGLKYTVSFNGIKHKVNESDLVPFVEQTEKYVQAENENGADNSNF